MEGLIVRQAEILEEVKRIHSNFKKDSASRKTTDYIRKRLERLDVLWAECEEKNRELSTVEDKDHQYFTGNIYGVIKSWYQGTRQEIAAVEMKTLAGPSNAGHSKLNIEFDKTLFETSVGAEDKLFELQQLQQANFRAFTRLVNRSQDKVQEKWEIEDMLKTVEFRWTAIDKLHLQIDGILEGNSQDYYDEYGRHEDAFTSMKRALNTKLNASVHQQQTLPKIDIPTFNGNYTLWPTFMDLYVEAIHNNSAIAKTQKMQHLKGRLRGEAEKLVQHLHIAPENYDTCWEILNHRYNNKFLLFTKNFQVFMRQPNLQKQSAFDLKRLYDTTNETINAIHNLGIDTSSWDPILVYVLCEKLDSDTYSEYMQSRSDPREIPTYNQFMDFVENKFMALEPLHRKKPENGDKPASKPHFKTPHPFGKYPKSQPNKSSANYSRNFHASNAGQFSKIICPLCNVNHALFQCSKFADMLSPEKMAFIENNKICKNCLYVHTKGYCASQKRCRDCNEPHNTLLHSDIVKSAQTPSATQTAPKPSSSTSTRSNKNLQNNFASNNDDEILLPTALVQVATAGGDYITLRALVDQGSQITLITENATQRLGIKRQQLSANISGIGTLSNRSKGKVCLSCKSLYNDFQFTTEALIMTRVVNSLPNVTFAKKPWAHVTDITLADPDYNLSRPIDILLDAHVFSEILMNGLVKGEVNEPMAQQTRLGWILSGNVTKTFNCNVVVNEVNDLSKYWEVEDINGDACNSMTSEERYCEEFYTATTKRLSDGRYAVRLPMKPNFNQLLGKSKPRAVAQFMQLERRLGKDVKLSDSYIKFMQEYLEMGHMKESKPGCKLACYLPHHGVLKQDSVTSKLRVVFNASQKTDTGYSLNDLMECGPKLHQDLLTLLLGWRLYKYVFTADCEKMYRMILVHEEDQHLQKILWRESNQGPLKEFQLCTVTYGTKAAPFLALRTLKQLADDDAQKYPLAADVIANEMYVDDVLSGSNSIERAQEIQKQLIDMLSGAGLTLRKWSSNDQTLIDSLSSSDLNQTTMHFTNDGMTRALGVQWNPTTDTFSFTNKIQLDNKNQLTKRKLLSEISKIFDPLGWLTPLTVKAKLLFQSVWLSGCEWDDTLPDSVQEEWKQLTSDLHNITEYQIPRWLGDITKPFQVHGFCDASEKAYACAIYLLTTNDKNEPATRLIAAKSRLSPINKKLTLPRLELCGALLLSRLMKKVLTAFKWDNVHKNTYAWTDSMIVLGWLHGDVTKWKSFVSNRVQQVHDVIPKHHWSYVKSEENAADCASRGISCSQLLQHSMWWQGPYWMKNYSEDTSNKITITPTTCESKQKQMQTYVVKCEPSSIVIELLDRHSDLTRITRVIAWMKRFINSCLKTNTHRTTTYLTSKELQSAENLILKHIQLHAFNDEIMRLKENRGLSTKSNILSLNPFLDKHDTLRVGGRLRNSNLPEDTKHPILLPHDNKLTELFIWQAHSRTLHGGPKLTLTHLRQRVWIVGGHRAVKKVLHKCVTCRRFNAKQTNQIMADLPKPRVTVSRPFTHTGVDFTGHIEIKASKGRGVKTLLAYVAVFVCLATKAIHLELVSELSSIAFLSAFKRFCARRGTPRDMYSDNGTNFVGANRILLQQYKCIVENIDNFFLGKISEMGVQWHFNAPVWPSAGGLWEAAVKSMKYHLKRVIGDQRLTYEELTTLLCQIEACLNSRPLCTVSENAEEINCLTPGHFLTGTSLMTIPEPDMDKTYRLNTRWQIVQQLSKDFWKKWSQEYLQQLQARLKWKRQNTGIKKNDIVCIKDERLPAGKWALGRVADLHPGKDGHTRVVTLKTAKGETKRPITKLVSLVEAEEQNNPDTDKLPKNRRNRAKRISWNSLVCYMLMLVMTSITPTVQQDMKRTQLTKNQTLYFDKIADLQEIRDEWKLVFYYNMTNYWRNVDTLQLFVSHIKQARCEEWMMQFHVLINQLEQCTSELNYYNELLRSQRITQHRFKRGLIDGVGYVANSLFGVLDQHFAEQYEQDIDTIQHNENHLLQLLKNQTSVLETENNIVQRNEATMAKQFTLINDHLKSLENKTLKDKLDSSHAFYIITSAIAAERMAQNLKDIQGSLINTLTNMYQGHMDVHLLSPTQMQSELDRVARLLPRDSTLPEVHNDIRDTYRLFRIHARITQQYLLMEIKVPILSDALYELNRLISIPQRIDINRVMYVIPNSALIAFNANQYSFIPLEQHDINECQKSHDQSLLCKLNHPIYNTGDRHKSICDVQLIRDNEEHSVYCHTEIKICADKWVKLHKQNTWFYYCCDTCEVQLVCGTQMTSETLRHSGLITLKQGCNLQGDSFTLHAYMEHTSDILVNEPYAMIVPTISPINNIINTSIRNSSWHIETHEETFKKIDTQLRSIQEQSKLDTLSSHDVHHYIAIYVVVAISIALFVTSVYFWRKMATQRRGEGPQDERSRSRREEDHDIEDRNSKIDKRDSKGNKVSCANPTTSEVKFDTEKHSDVC